MLPWTPFTRKSLISKRLAPMPKTPGEHLYQKRLADGCTQADLALQLGVSEFTLLNWERGHTKVIPSESMPAIVAYLGYNPEPRPETVGAQLRWKRRSMGWTIAEAAKRNAVDQSTWEAWEKLDRWPSYPRFRSLLLEFLG
jgi:transcriptional regulator with XRE-family HTH domain